MSKNYKRSYLRIVPIWAVCIIAYLVLGFVFHEWWRTLIIVLVPSLWDSVIRAVERKNPNAFEFPLLVVGVYLYIGLFWNMWHPYWVIFLLIPAYYSIVNSFRSVKKYRRGGGEKIFVSDDDGNDGDEDDGE